MLDSWQINGVQDSEVTADRLRDWEEKVAENVKHADGYLHEVERIHHPKKLLKCLLFIAQNTVILIPNVIITHLVEMLNI